MLGSLLALVHAHKQCLTVDKEAVATYDTKLKEERKRADDQVWKSNMFHKTMKYVWNNEFKKLEELKFDHNQDSSLLLLGSVLRWHFSSLRR